MIRRMLGSRGGFTYIAALVMVIVTGIMAAKAAVVWKTAMQREREAELISRGTQIRDALRRWYKVKVVEGQTEPVPIDPKAPPPNLPELKSLLLDPNTPGKLRYLRPYALIDPMNPEDDHEWDLVKDAAGKIIGVKSKSELAPVKQGNFPFDLHPGDFEKKKKYSEWQFIYNRIPPAGATGGFAPSTKGTTPP